MLKMTVGSVPFGEPSAQVGQPRYEERARMECVALMRQIARVHPPPPGGLLLIEGHSHEYGTYYEVSVQAEPEAEDWAFLVDANTPEFWDGESLSYLFVQGYYNLPAPTFPNR